MAMPVTVNLNECGVDIHSIPCKIGYDGEAKVSEYFKSSVSSKKTTVGKEDVELKASLRGRPLAGKEVEMPQNYSGFLLKQSKNNLTDSPDSRKFEVTQTFQKFTYWTLEKEPFNRDKFNGALKWLEIAQALHCQEGIESSQGSQQSVQGDH